MIMMIVFGSEVESWKVEQQMNGLQFIFEWLIFFAYLKNSVNPDNPDNPDNPNNPDNPVNSI